MGGAVCRLACAEVKSTSADPAPVSPGADDELNLTRPRWTHCLVPSLLPYPSIGPDVPIYERTNHNACKPGYRETADRLLRGHGSERSQRVWLLLRREHDSDIWKQPGDQGARSHHLGLKRN